MYSGNDDIRRCPYNKNHRVPRSRFQRHLVKCEKNYPPDYKVICPYDATHRLNKQEIEEHIETCPMRKTVEASYIQLTDRTEECNSTSEIDYNSYWNSSQEEI
ncbi:hypothetical protein P5V15_003290 [Pogonomyrmex californicus]